MNFKLKADTIFVVRFALAEMYYLEKSLTTAATVSRPTLFALTKKFTNKQLTLYKDLLINDKKLHKMSFEIHEAVLLRSILLNTAEEINNQYSIILLNQFLEDLWNSLHFLKN